MSSYTTRWGWSLSFSELRTGRKMRKCRILTICAHLSISTYLSITWPSCNVSSRICLIFVWVPAPYKQTKNQTNATTDITAGSCYREVRWNWKVTTNGQNPTFSHLSARSQLRKWQCPSSSRCVAGHRQGHQEKDPHFSKELAHGCWKLNNNLSPSLGLFTRESSLCD